MTEKVEVRRAEPADAEGIARIHVESWRETYSEIMSPSFFSSGVLAQRQRMWSGLLAMDPVPGNIVVATRAGEVIGFAFSGSSQHPDAQKGIEPARELHLFSIYLLASEHGHGIGHALMSKALGDHPAQLWVAATNIRARSFYERHGFGEDGSQIVDPSINDLIELRMIR